MQAHAAEQVLRSNSPGAAARAGRRIGVGMHGGPRACGGARAHAHAHARMCTREGACAAGRACLARAAAYAGQFAQLTAAVEDKVQADRSGLQRSRGGELARACHAMSDARASQGRPGRPERTGCARGVQRLRAACGLVQAQPAGAGCGRASGRAQQAEATLALPRVARRRGFCDARHAPHAAACPGPAAPACARAAPPRQFLIAKHVH